MTSIPLISIPLMPIPSMSIPSMATPRLCVRLAAVLLLAFAAAAPAQDLDLYEGEVLVSSQGQGERAAALPRALAQVFVKLTGDAGAAREPVLAARLADAQRLLQQYRYRQDVVPEGGSARVQLWLIARFDPAGVDTLLAEAGRSVWPTPRPAPLLWLAIDDGRGPRLVSSAQAGAVSALTAQARNRGLRIQFPLVDLEDQGRVDVGDVWNGRHEALVAASARYQAPTQLVGRLLRTGSTWDGVWTLLDGGQALSQWRSSDPDPLVVLAAGADGAADALTARYAVPATAGEPGQYRIDVVGIRSAEDYLRASNHLRELGVVRRLRVLSADASTLRLELDMGTGLEGLARALQSGNVLEMLMDEAPASGLDPAQAPLAAGADAWADAPATGAAGIAASVAPADAVLRLLP